jgi:sRNA-binding protein
MNMRLLLVGMLFASLNLSACVSTGGAPSASDRNNLNGNLRDSIEEEQSSPKVIRHSNSSDQKTSKGKEPLAAKPVQAQPKIKEKADAEKEVQAASTGKTPAPAVMVVNNSKAKFRNKPSTKAVVIKTLKKGEEVKVVAQKDEWFQVELAGGAVGWCHNSVLGARP